MSLLKMDLNALPVHHIRRGSRGGAVVLILFGLLMLGLSAIAFPGPALLDAWDEGRFPSTGQMRWFAPWCFGLVLLTWGLWNWTETETLRIDGVNVDWSRRVLFLKRHGSEPVSSFRGFRVRSERRREFHSSPRPPFQVHYLELDHVDPRRRRRLFESTVLSPVLRAQEHAGQLLGLPALARDGSVQPLPVGATIAAVNAADFDREVRAAPLPVLVEYWSEWTEPCILMDEVLQRVAANHAGRLRVLKFDVGDARFPENRLLAERQGVRLIPTLMVFKDGQMVGSLNALRGLPDPEAVQALIDRSS